jgi:hypothetical protein
VSTQTLIATLVGGVAGLVAGLVLIALGEHQVGVVITAAAAGELGVKGVAISGGK